MARHYLDHASTTPARPEAVAAMAEQLASVTGDPGRLHEEGRHVRSVLEEARRQVAGLLGVGTRQIVFTSGGTESVNAAVWGATRARPGAVVLTSGVEHSCVRDASARLAPVEELAVDSRGRIEVAAVEDALARHTAAPPALVHCQWANHEVGTVQPVAEIVALCRAAGVLVHVDAVAACGHLDLDLAGLDADLVSLSAHKFGGPPGAGALVVRRNLRIEPLLVGGLQERARRAGMENVPAMTGFGAAAAVLSADGRERLSAESVRARSQCARLQSAATGVDGVTVVGERDDERRLPHIVCLGVAGVEAEPVLMGLDRSEVAAHSGSACSSEALEPSPVLAAMGEDPSHSLRLSVGWSTSDADVDAFIEAFPRVVADLRSLRAGG